MLSAKVILKYALIQLAQLAVVAGVLMVIRHFVSVSAWVIVAVLALWLLKDLALFPKLWRAYAFDDNRPIRRLIGLEATVVYSLDPMGYVRVKGELWKAEVTDPARSAKRGDRTRVVGIKGATLIVERCNDR